MTVTGVADNLSDGDQSYTIVLGSDDDSTDLRFRYVDPPDVTVTNVDLTGQGSYYVSAASRDTDENGEKSSFTIRLASAPTDNVMIYVSSSDTSEGQLNRVGDNSTLVGPDNNTVKLLFTTEDWSSDQTVEVTGVADNLSDGDQAYAILLSADNSTGDSSYLYIDPPDVTLRNLDLTDKGRFYVSAISGNTDENEVEATFTVRLSSAPSGDATTDNVTITMSSSDTSEGRLSVSTTITTDNA